MLQKFLGNYLNKFHKLLVCQLQLGANCKVLETWRISSRREKGMQKALVKMFDSESGC